MHKRFGTWTFSLSLLHNLVWTFSNLLHTVLCLIQAEKNAEEPSQIHSTTVSKPQYFFFWFHSVNSGIFFYSCLKSQLLEVLSKPTFIFIDLIFILKCSHNSFYTNCVFCGDVKTLNVHTASEIVMHDATWC